MVYGNYEEYKFVKGVRGYGFKSEGYSKHDSIGFVRMKNNLDRSMGNDITVSLWFNLEYRSAPVYHEIISQNDNGGYFLRVNYGEIQLTLKEDGATTDPINTGYNIEWGKTYHIVFQIFHFSETQSKVDIFVNGTLIHQHTSPYHIDGTNQKVHVGDLSSSNGVFQGWIDEVMLFRRVLSSDEIMALFNGNGGELEITVPYDDTALYSNFYACSISLDGERECTERRRLTGDSVPPVISNYDSSKTLCDEFTITFDTDIPSTVTVEYGFDGEESSILNVDDYYHTSHEVKLSKLRIGKEYTYSLHAYDMGGDKSDPVKTGSFSCDCKEEDYDFILPPPQKVIPRNTFDGLVLDDTWVIRTSNEKLHFTANWLKDKLSKYVKFSTDFSTDTIPPNSKTITLEVISEDISDYLDDNESSFPDFLGDEGYILEVFESNRIVITGNLENGVFYGVNTLIYLMRHDGFIEPITIIDYPDHKFRGLMNKNPNLDESLWSTTYAALIIDDSLIEIMDLLALWKYNAFMESDFKHFFSPEDSIKIIPMVSFKKFLEERFIEYIPGIAMITSAVYGNFPFSMIEGWWHRNISYTFQSNNLAEPTVPILTDLIVNGDFSNGLNDWVVETDTVTTRSGSSCYGGGTCIEITNNGKLYQLFSDIEIGAFYHVLYRHKGSDPSLSAQQFNDQNRYYTQTIDFLAGSPSTWQERYITLKVDTEAATLRIYLMGDGFYSDVRMYKISGLLSNVIRCDDSDIEVFSDDYSKQYEHLNDYTIIAGTEENMDFSINQPLFQIERNPSGDIPNEGEVKINFDSRIKAITGGDKNPLALSDSRFYVDYYYKALENAMKNIKPKHIMLWCDEVLGFNTDSRNLKRGLSNAELLSEYLNKMQEHMDLKAVEYGLPKMKSIIWNDMLTEYHTKGDSMLSWGSFRGSFQDIITDELINEKDDVNIAIWRYEMKYLLHIHGTIKFFSDYGHHFYSSPGCYEYDPIPLFAEISVNMEKNLGGLMTSFGDSVRRPYYKVFAKHFWNTKYTYIFFNSFENNPNDDMDSWTFYSDPEETDFSAIHVDAAVSGPSLVSGDFHTKYHRYIVKLDYDSGLRSVYIEANENKEYVFYAESRSVSGTITESPSFIFSWYDDNTDAGLIKNDFRNASDIEVEYKSFKFEFVSPESTKYVRIGLFGGENELFYFDTIRLKERFEEFPPYLRNDGEGDSGDDDDSGDDNLLEIIIISVSSILFVVVVLVVVILILIFFLNKNRNR